MVNKKKISITATSKPSSTPKIKFKKVSQKKKSPKVDVLKEKKCVGKKKADLLREFENPLHISNVKKQNYRLDDEKNTKVKATEVPKNETNKNIVENSSKKKNNYKPKQVKVKATEVPKNETNKNIVENSSKKKKNYKPKQVKVKATEVPKNETNKNIVENSSKKKINYKPKQVKVKATEVPKNETNKNIVENSSKKKINYKPKQVKVIENGTDSESLTVGRLEEKTSEDEEVQDTMVSQNSTDSDSLTLGRLDTCSEEVQDIMVCAQENSGEDNNSLGIQSEADGQIINEADNCTEPKEPSSGAYNPKDLKDQFLRWQEFCSDPELKSFVATVSTLTSNNRLPRVIMVRCDETVLKDQHINKADVKNQMLAGSIQSLPALPKPLTKDMLLNENNQEPCFNSVVQTKSRRTLPKDDREIPSPSDIILPTSSPEIISSSGAKLCVNTDKTDLQPEQNTISSSPSHIILPRSLDIISSSGAKLCVNTDKTNLQPEQNTISDNNIQIDDNKIVTTHPPSVNISSEVNGNSVGNLYTPCHKYSGGMVEQKPLVKENPKASNSPSDFSQKRNTEDGQKNSPLEKKAKRCKLDAVERNNKLKNETYSNISKPSDIILPTSSPEIISSSGAKLYVKTDKTHLQPEQDTILSSPSHIILPTSLVKENPKASNSPSDCSQKRKTEDGQHNSPLEKKVKHSKLDAVERKNKLKNGTYSNKSKPILIQSTSQTCTATESSDSSLENPINFLVKKAPHCVVPKSAVCPTFKPPQIFPEKKVQPQSLKPLKKLQPQFETTEKFIKKPSDSKNTGRNVSNIPPKTLGPNIPQPNVDYFKTPKVTKSNYDEEEEDDDNMSCISMMVNENLIKFVDDVSEPNGLTNTKINDRRNVIKNRSILMNKMYPNQMIQGTSYNNRFNPHTNRPSCSSNTKPEEEENKKRREEELPRHQQFSVPTRSYHDKLNSDFSDDDDMDDNPLAYKRRSSNNEDTTEHMEQNLQTESTFTSVCNDSHECENSLNDSFEIGSAFYGYCVEYLRRSITRSQEHPCNLKHEVPDVLLQSPNEVELKNIASAIRFAVDSQHFSNPPKEFLEGIILNFISRTNQSLSLIESVVIHMKTSMSINDVNPKRKLEIWSHFLKLLLNNIVKFQKDPYYAINRLLAIVLPINPLQMKKDLDLKILDCVLNELAIISTRPSIYLKLLDCITFLRKDGNKDSKLPITLLSKSYIEAVIHQVLDKVGNVRFMFRVYKTLFDDLDDCIFIYNINKALALDFLKKAEQMITTSSNDDVREKLNHLLEMERNNQPSPKYSSNTRHLNYNIRDLERQRSKIQEVTNPSTLAGMLAKNPPSLIFDKLRSNGGQHYLEMLQDCEDTIKKKCNCITMSFILLESKKDNWALCYSLFEAIIDFDPDNIQDFVNIYNSRNKRLLIIIRCILNTNNVGEAVFWFTKCNMCSISDREINDPSKWCLEDKELWEKVCQDIGSEIGQLQRYSEVEATLFVTIIKQQKDFQKPIRLVDGLLKFFWQVADLCEPGSWNAIAEVVLAIMKEEKLFNCLHLDIERYRILITAICRANNRNKYDGPAICVRIMRRANRSCEIYPTSWNKDCNELTVKTSLTVDELQAFIYFKITVFKKMLEQKSLHIMFEEQDYGWKKPYFKNIDCSVSGAIGRFKIACQNIGMNPTSLIVRENKVIVDKVMQQELLNPSY